MRIVIDMQGAQSESRFRGIGRYTLSFAQAIVRNRGEHEVFLALSGLFPTTIDLLRTTFDGLLPPENIRVWYAPGPVRELDQGSDWRRDAAELIREAFLASLRPDVIHVTSLFEGFCDDAVVSIGRFDMVTPVSVTLYDLIPFLNPDHYLEPNPIYRKFYERKIESLLRATYLLAISEFSRQEGVDCLDFSSERIVNVSTAVEDRFRELKIADADAAAIKEKFNISRSFVLYTGGADERKNLPRLIQAYARLPLVLRKTHQLVFAGKIEEGNAEALRRVMAEEGLASTEVCFTGYVTDEELVAFYNLCTVFIFPSWHEGFGLPALEAMACGAAVIASNLSSIPEVIACEEALFDPFDVYAMADKMQQVLEDHRLRAHLREQGRSRAKCFSWDDTAQRAIRAYENMPCPQQRNLLDANGLCDQLVRKISLLTKPDVSDHDLQVVACAIDRSFPEKLPRQLFVDVSELCQRDARTGVQRVTRSILNQLLRTPLGEYVVEPVYATVDQQGYRYARKYMHSLEAGAEPVSDDLISPRPSDIFLGLDLQHHATLAQKEFLASIRNDGVVVLFVVYDLLPIYFPCYWPVGVSAMHRDWLMTICGFDGVVCISRSVSDEMGVWMSENYPARSRFFSNTWFHLGADIDNSVPSKYLPEDADETLFVLKKRKTFLSVGTLEPRKGQAQTLAAFELLWHGGHDVNLVLVGKQGWMVDNLVEEISQHPELGQKLFWLDGVSDEYLERVYEVSSCLIAASEGEGFGLPLIEAAQHGVPIIARDIPVFKEVAGACAMYFSGREPIQIEQAVLSWLELDAMGDAPQSNDMQWLTWRQSAEQLADAIGIKKACS